MLPDGQPYRLLLTKVHTLQRIASHDVCQLPPVVQPQHVGPAEEVVGMVEIPEMFDSGSRCDKNVCFCDEMTCGVITV